MRHFLMVIDFHTHVFPEKIAKKTILSLAEKSQNRPYAYGTLPELLASMQRSGVTQSVVLPVVTKPSQFDSVNRYAAEINGKNGIISFGGIHPDDPDVDAHLDQIKAMGFRGIKLHPDYQQTFIDDPKYLHLIEGCIQRDLLVVTHAGFDEGYPEVTHCTPKRVVAMLQAIYGTSQPTKFHIVLARGGANRMFEEAEELLCGKPVYFDLAYILSYISDEQLMRLIRKHGVDRILFATDHPWSDPAQGIARIHSLPLTEAEKEKILWENAASLLQR